MMFAVEGVMAANLSVFEGHLVIVYKQYKSYVGRCEVRVAVSKLYLKTQFSCNLSNWMECQSSSRALKHFLGGLVRGIIPSLIGLSTNELDLKCRYIMALTYFDSGRLLQCPSLDYW